MDFADERYIRLYTRDTATWKLLNWQARCVAPLLFRKCDRAGVIEFGGARMDAALAALIDVPEELIEPAVASMVERQVVELHDHWLVFPNFIEAQEAAQTDKRRAQESRARRRDRARRTKLAAGAVKPGVTKRDDPSQNVTQLELPVGEGAVTNRDDPSQNVTPTPGRHVTNRDDPSQNVTPTRLGSESPVTKRDRTESAKPGVKHRPANGKGGVSHANDRHTASQDVTPSQPSQPSQPSLAVPDQPTDVDPRSLPSSQLEGDAGWPPRPTRRIEAMDEKVHVTQWEPHPDAQAYATAIGLTGREFKTTLLELKTRLRTETGYPGFFDDRFCSFLEARARQDSAGDRRASKSGPAPKKPKQSNETDLSMLDDEDREMFGDYLAGLD